MSEPVVLPATVAEAFRVPADATLLVGGEGRTFAAGNFVLRRENPSDEIEAEYTAELLDAITEDGFRVARPLRIVTGAWLAPGAWSAWTFVEGRAATRDDAPEMVRAIEAFHRAIATAPYPRHIARRTSPYWRADQAAWADIPRDVDAEIAPIIARLSALRRPVETSAEQVIHGDANEQNILIADAMCPAIINMATYWRPPEFALAVTAFWLGAYRDDADVSVHFEHVREFDQMLLRACVRSLLVMDGFAYRYEPGPRRTGRSGAGASRLRARTGGRPAVCAVGVATRTRTGCALTYRDGSTLF